jgi:hypothetical protein
MNGIEVVVTMNKANLSALRYIFHVFYDCLVAYVTKDIHEKYSLKILYYRHLLVSGKINPS